MATVQKMIPSPTLQELQVIVPSQLSVLYPFTYLSGKGRIGTLVRALASHAGGRRGFEPHPGRIQTPNFSEHSPVHQAGNGYPESSREGKCCNGEEWAPPSESWPESSGVL